MTAELERRVLELEDRVALADLLHHYSTGIDNFDLDLLGSIVTDDFHAEHGAVAPPLDGREAFLEVIRQTWPRFRFCQHYISNPKVTLAGDRAEVRAFLLAVHHVDALDGSDSTDLIPAGAQYTFKCRRTEWGWQTYDLLVQETWADDRIAVLYGHPGADT